MQNAWAWWRHGHTQLRCVAGLAVLSDRVQLVVVTGSLWRPQRVCCAQDLALPADVLVDGLVQAPEALAGWLQAQLPQPMPAVQQWHVALPDAQLMRHSVSLSAHLLPADVRFQLAQEVRALWGDVPWQANAPADLGPSPSSGASRQHDVVACAPACVDAWQAWARAGGCRLVSLQPASDALRRARQSPHTQRLAPDQQAQALSCDTAWGLALTAWHKQGVNFMPHPHPRWQAWQQAGVLAALGCALAGAGVVAVGGWALTAAADAAQNTLQHAAPAQALWQAAKLAHDQTLQRQQWLQARQAEQAQTQAWAQALEASSGVWLSQVVQQTPRWWLQGEALSAQQAQQVLAQLKALDIWAQAPELVQLQVGRSATPSTQAVWLFRIEATLKAAQP